MGLLICSTDPHLIKDKGSNRWGHDVPDPMMIARNTVMARMGILPWRSHGFYRRGNLFKLEQTPLQVKGHSTGARVGARGPWGGAQLTPTWTRGS